MRVHGSRRETFDVDICLKSEAGNKPILSALLQSSRYNTDLLAIGKFFANRRRIILPSSKLFDSVLRFYVKTGRASVTALRSIG